MVRTRVEKEVAAGGEKDEEKRAGEEERYDDEDDEDDDDDEGKARARARVKENNVGLGRRLDDRDATTRFRTIRDPVELDGIP